MSDADGMQTTVYDQMVRDTIMRRVDIMDTEELLDLLGHLIARERRVRFRGDR